MGFLDLFRKKPAVDIHKAYENLNRAAENLLIQQTQLETRHLNERREGFLISAAGHRQREPITDGYLWEAQRLSRYFVKHVPEAQSFVRNMVCYTVGAQPSFAVNGSRNNKSFLDALNRINNLSELLINAYTHYLEDGEVFIRLKRTPEGVPQLIIIPPERVKAPPDGNVIEWSFGVYADPDNWRDITQYCVYNYDYTQYEIVDKKYIFHLFNNPGHKRGFPVLATPAAELLDIEDLREAGRKGEAARQAIAFIRQHAMATQQDLHNFSSIVEGRQLDHPASHTVPMSIIRSGSIVDVPEGLETKDPPSVKQANSHDLQLQATTYAISAATGVPDWAISGRPFAGSFASSLTAESPFTKKLEYEQGILIDLFQRLISASFAINNQLSNNTEIEIDVVLPDPETKDFKAETESNQILFNNKLLSGKTWTGMAGLDYDEEQENIKSEEPLEVDVRTGEEPDENSPN